MFPTMKFSRMFTVWMEGTGGVLSSMQRSPYQHSGKPDTHCYCGCYPAMRIPCSSFYLTAQPTVPIWLRTVRKPRENSVCVGDNNQGRTGTGSKVTGLSGAAQRRPAQWIQQAQGSVGYHHIDDSQSSHIFGC